MTYDDVQLRLSELYLVIARWCFLHPLRTDAGIIAAVLLICTYVLRRNRRRRHKLYRLLWGAYMSRRDRVRYHMKGFEDALVDYAMEAVHQGRMTEAEEKIYLEFFADKAGMAGLRNGVDPKRGIRARLKLWYNKKPRLPGGRVEVKRDPTYDGSKSNGGPQTSRYFMSKELTPPD